MPARRSFDRSYRQAQVDARRATLDLRAEVAAELTRALRDYADELAARIGRLRAAGDTQRALAAEEAVTAVRQAADTLHRRVADAIEHARPVAYHEVTEIWRRATEAAAMRYGVPGPLVSRIRLPRVELLGAYEALGSAASTWRTLLDRHSARAVADVTYVVRNGILEGLNPQQLARALRPYVQGAETLRQAFGKFKDVSPERLKDPKLEEAARRMRFNADRIAVSELHNARKEAEVQNYALDPLVAAVGWRLSPFRGPAARIPDICDLLAANDIFGLGVGVYPISLVPLTPHPYDRCELVPITRDPALVASPKPEPSRVFDPTRTKVPSTTPRRRARLLAQLEDLMDATRAGAPAEVRLLLEQAAGR